MNETPLEFEVVNPKEKSSESDIKNIDYYADIYEKYKNGMMILLAFIDEFAYMVQEKISIASEKNEMLKAGDFANVISIAHSKFEAIYIACDIENEFQKRWSLLFAAIIVPYRDFLFNGEYERLLAEQYGKTPKPRAKKFNNSKPKDIKKAKDDLIRDHVLNRYKIHKSAIINKDYDFIKIIYKKKIDRKIERYIEILKDKRDESAYKSVFLQANEDICNTFKDFLIIGMHIFGFDFEKDLSKITDHSTMNDLIDDFQSRLKKEIHWEEKNIDSETKEFKVDDDIDL